MVGELGVSGRRRAAVGAGGTTAEVGGVTGMSSVEVSLSSGTWESCSKGRRLAVIWSYRTSPVGRLIGVGGAGGGLPKKSAAVDRMNRLCIDLGAGAG